MVSAMVESLRASLFATLPDFGRHLGYDGKAVASHSTGRVGKDGGKTSDPDADWGKHETSGVNGKTGAVWKKVKSWFGYGLHLIADTRYEVSVAFEVTRASASEPKVLSRMLEELFARVPEMVLRRLQRRPRSRRWPPEGAAVGPVDRPPALEHMVLGRLSGRQSDEGHVRGAVSATTRAEPVRDRLRHPAQAPRSHGAA